jgi:hypothetical protein
MEGDMAVREFTARDGREWRVWDVTAASLEPLTRAEDYLADCYRDGWVVFETLDGTEKRRLCPPPYAWDKRSDIDLEALLLRADTLRPKGEVRVRGDVLFPADLPPNVPKAVADAMPRDVDGNLDMHYLGVVRTFGYPGGETWRVAVVDVDPDLPLVLRFASSSHTIDLSDWPADWMDMTDDGLVALLRAAGSAHDRRRNDLPRRCHDDPGPDANAR